MKYLERVEVDNDILTLATKYIEEKVVGQTSFDDCIHIATATIRKADILTSWNFKHIVNIYRIRGYNSINLRMNNPSLEIWIFRSNYDASYFGYTVPLLLSVY